MREDLEPASRADSVTVVESEGHASGETESGRIRRWVEHRRTPWLALMFGLLLAFIGAVIAWVSFNSLMTASTAMPILTWILGIFGLPSPVDSANEGWLSKMIFLASGLLACGLGIMVTLTSISVLVHRGARKTISGTRKVAEFAREKELGRKARYGAERMADQTKGLASSIKEHDLKERARGSIGAGASSFRDQGLRLGETVSSRIRDAKQGFESARELENISKPEAGNSLPSPSRPPEDLESSQKSDETENG